MLACKARFIGHRASVAGACGHNAAMRNEHCGPAKYRLDYVSRPTSFGSRNRPLRGRAAQSPEPEFEAWNWIHGTARRAAGQKIIRVERQTRSPNTGQESNRSSAHRAL